MIRRTLPFKRATAVVAGSTVTTVRGVDPAELPSDSAVQVLPPQVAHRGRRLTWKRAFLFVIALLVVAAAALYPSRHNFTAQGADFSRKVIGDENTARVESWYFRFEDRVNKLKYRIFGADSSPFASGQVRVEFIPHQPPQEIVYFIGAGAKAGTGLTPDTLGPLPVQLPKTIPLRDTLEAGEGVWTTAGLPRSNPTDVLMAKTFIRPDKSRPFALVGILHIDTRRVRLHMTGGTGEPGGYRGVKGPGIVPKDAYSELLAAWTGGFKGPHGNYGMYADGKEYVPLRNGLASAVVYKNGTVKLGQWGRDVAWSDDIESVRQNAVLLVDNGEISKRVTEGNDTWGYVNVNSAEFITWRSAVGLTKDGNLLMAAGNSLSAETLAKALWAAGAYTAMQLDINSPYVLTSLYTPLPDGTVRAEKFMESMPDSPMRFVRPHERDLMYVTLDESKYK